MKRAVPLLLASVLVLIVSHARAMTPPVERPARIALLEGSTDVELKAVEIVLRCAAIDDCSFLQTYLVASDDEREVTLVADGHRIAGLELEVGGAAVLGSNVIRDNEGDRNLPAVTRTTRRYLARLPAGDTTIVLRGGLNPRDHNDTVGVAVSLATRHPLFGRDPGWQRRNFLFDLSTRDTWGGEVVPTLELDIAPELDVTSGGGELDPERSLVSVWTAQRPRGLVHGGPYIGLGGTLDRRRAWFGRFGYELGLGLWTVFGLALDTDFSSRVVVSPTIHGASAAFSCILPSVGIGLGPAVQFGSLTAVGGRGLLELQFPLVGLVGHIDWYPGLESPDRIDLALLGRLSF